MDKRYVGECRLLWVFILSCIAIHVDGYELPRLILISMDGFRYNYLDSIPANKTNYFQHFINNGVKADWIDNVFPTVTYPNHYTLITGLYPESHGLVDNKFFDPYYKQWYDFRSMVDNVDLRWYDNGAEPIYVTNNKAGDNRRSGSVLWPAGLARVKCVAPDRVIPNADCMNNLSMLFRKRVDYLMSWMTDSSEPVNLGLLYISEPDETGHATGPLSKAVKDEIIGPLNDALGYLMDKLKAAGILESTNIILTSDHGMSLVNDNVNLDDFLDPAWYKTAADWHLAATMQIFPNAGHRSHIIQSLGKAPGISVYQKGGKELMALHYNNNPRIAPIILEADEGVIIANNRSISNITLKGAHGYHPILVKNARPFFMAAGPAFKKGYSSEPFHMVNIYPLMCHLLGVAPAHNNGSLDNVRQLLQSQPGARTLDTTAVTYPYDAPFDLFIYQMSQDGVDGRLQWQFNKKELKDKIPHFEVLMCHYKYGEDQCSKNENFTHFLTSKQNSVNYTGLAGGYIYAFKVRLDKTDGYYGKLSTVATIPVKGSRSGASAAAQDVTLSRTNLIAIIVSVSVVVLALVAVMGYIVMRHRRLQRSFRSFASSHYDSQSGMTMFTAADELGEDEDAPMIRGFSDDEPLVIA